MASSMANFGLVSVIIPVYNRPFLLEETVSSVLSQTYRLFEILLVDDGSEPATRLWCDRLATRDARVRVLHLRHTGRPGLVREGGRHLARGQYIQYLDSDDLLAPRKLEVMTSALADSGADVAYCFTRRYRRNDTVVDVPCERTGELFDRMLPEFLGGRFWHTCTPLYTRRITDAAGPWSSLRYWEDVEYDFRIARLEPKLVHCREFLADFRDHDEDRLSTPGFFNDPAAMTHAPAAYRLLCEHAFNSGVSSTHTALRAFREEVTQVAHQCHALGLHREASECLALLA
jgi:glycosyltransferase involved in cell wall biosynthesis